MFGELIVLLPFVENLMLVPIGIIVGVLSSLLGIGGGVFIVPLCVFLGYEPINAVGISSVAVLVAATASSFRSLRMREINLRAAALLGGVAVCATPLGVFVAMAVDGSILITGFAFFLLFNVALFIYKLRLKSIERRGSQISFSVLSTNSVSKLILIGLIAGFLGGMFGIGGGVVIIPLLLLFLAMPIKLAVKLSLSAVVLTSFAASTLHLFNGNILLIPALLIALGSVLGAYIGNKFIPSISEFSITVMYVVFLSLLSISLFMRVLFT